MSLYLFSKKEKKLSLCQRGTVLCLRESVIYDRGSSDISAFCRTSCHDPVLFPGAHGAADGGRSIAVDRKYEGGGYLGEIGRGNRFNAGGVGSVSSWGEKLLRRRIGIPGVWNGQSGRGEVILYRKLYSTLHHL